ncbi:helix-turn-helix domain-containing protein [Nocardia amikacinitolerans]|uniref:helix-turn-helix domain-containing protein n=1 Tax=Nocardia amikacinitolerans TaxID=756689 RepID=UPI0020A3222B|nr:helix-turn-helix domain-containing protein [Nocardia amikacinitolerans]MCP2288834.1 Transcriptional regulator of acetoin/glycerol metabolism [Nocardia amikacinitolerans]
MTPGPVATDSGLVRAARPVLRRTLGEIEGSRVALVLADHAACILEVEGAVRSVSQAIEDVGIVPGVRLAEERIGTNAMGTPLETRRSLLVRGAEHYLSAFHAFTCYGHPIFHPVTRRLEGVLGIGGQFDEDHRLSAPLARRIVRDIEDRLQLDSPRVQGRLMSAFQAAASRRGRSVVVIGEGLVLATPSALDLLTPVDHAAVRACAEGLRPGAEESHRLTLASGQEVRLTCAPIEDTQGVLVDICAERGVRRSAAEQVVRWPLLVVGERGTGRTAEALRAAGPAATVLDATEIVLLGEQTWATELGVALGEPGPPVVVENIELLSAPLTALLARNLRRTARQVALTSTPGDHLDEVHAALSALCNDRLDLLPLRRRRHEIPQLAQRMLTEVTGHTRTRFTSETLRVLAGQPWRGNFAELRRVVEAAAAARSAGDIIPADLPVAHRAARSPGSPFLEAEREVILAAIEAAGGNKMQAARALGVSRSTLYNRLRVLRIA